MSAPMISDPPVRFDRVGVSDGFTCAIVTTTQFTRTVGGSRRAYEVYTQLLGRPGERQLASRTLGLTHHRGGVPYRGSAAISILRLR